MAHWQSWKGPEARARARKAEMFALGRTAQRILEGAKVEVPLDDGDLRDSGHIQRSRSTEPRVLIIFGGSTAPHAVKQHEARHFKHKGGRKSRYLADPFNRTAGPAYPQELRRAWREEFGS